MRHTGVSFYRSLKCGITENINFRKLPQSVRERAQYIREFSKENSKLNETRYFSVSFNRSISSFPKQIKVCLKRGSDCVPFSGVNLRKTALKSATAAEQTGFYRKHGFIS